MLNLLKRLAAGSYCPSCDGRLKAQDGGYDSCKCGVVVVTDRGGWRFSGETRFRPLPGIAGRFYREDAA